MLEAFFLGFWLIWSANRNIFPLSESLWFMIIAVIMRQLVAFSVPEINSEWGIFNGVLWAYVAAVFVFVDRFSSNFMTNLVMAAAAGIGYFQLQQHLPEWISNWPL